MALTDVVKSGLEGYLFYCIDPESSPEDWVELGYVTGFNFDENLSDRPVYKHYTIDHYKRQRNENTGSISHLFTNSVSSVLALKHKTVNLKLEIRDDGQEDATEQVVLEKVRLTNIRFQMPETDDMTMSADFMYATADWSEPDEGF